MRNAYFKYNCKEYYLKNYSDDNKNMEIKGE